MSNNQLLAALNINSSRLLRCSLFAAAMVWLMPVAFGGADNISYQGSFPPSTTSGMTHVILTVNGTPRNLLIYRPSTAQSLPLLIYLDGTGSDIASILKGDYSWLRDFADNSNLIIAVPAQRVMTYGDWDNHSAGTPYFETAVGDQISSPASSNPDTNPDLLFVRAIIKEASVAYGADLTRVYSLGFSNGAFFSYFVAATLNDKIAAFAESAGGLVLSNTTYGDPTPCAPTALPGITGAVRSCAAAGWSPGLCSTPGAMARPIAPGSVARVPPGFMEANDDDTTVPWANTCNLANALPASSNYVVRITHNGGGHTSSTNYMDNAWNFLKNFRNQNALATRITAAELALSTTPIDPNLVFDFGEANYAKFFPGHPANATLSPYLYRYYPASGNYLGAANGSIYVYGSSWKNVLTNVGTVESFRQPISTWVGTRPGGVWP